MVDDQVERPEEALAVSRGGHWTNLTPGQFGRYCEYLVSMELSAMGACIFRPEVDESGIDMLVRVTAGVYREVQVKSLRAPSPYAFAKKSSFVPCDALWMAFVRLEFGGSPKVYMIPSRDWLSPNSLLNDRPYGPDRKSPSEWGLSVTKKSAAILETYAIDRRIAEFLRPR